MLDHPTVSSALKQELGKVAPRTVAVAVKEKADEAPLADLPPPSNQPIAPDAPNPPGAAALGLRP